MNNFMAFLPVLLLASTQLIAAPPTNPPPIEVDAFVTNDDANPVPVEVINASTEYQFAGYTEKETSGGDANGYAGMNTICQNEFGDNARMCTTKEWFNTHGTQVLPIGDKAWVHPVLATAVYDTSSGEIVYNDWTGVQLKTDTSYVDRASCAQWLADGHLITGYVVESIDEGLPERITRSLCSNPARVTCCTSVQVPPAP